MEKKQQLDMETRARLARFVCVMAWADFKVQPEEREHILKLMQGLELDEETRVEIEGWLQTPPDPELVDPTQIPRSQRDRFLKEAELVIQADGRVYPEEIEMLSLFQSILYPEGRD